MTVWTVILILTQIILAEVFLCDSAGKESGCNFLAECWLIDSYQFHYYVQHIILQAKILSVYDFPD